MTAAGLIRPTSPPAFPSLSLSPRCVSGGSPRCVPHHGPLRHRSDTDTESTRALPSILSLRAQAETKKGQYHHSTMISALQLGYEACRDIYSLLSLVRTTVEKVQFVVFTIHTTHSIYYPHNTCTLLRTLLLLAPLIRCCIMLSVLCVMTLKLNLMSWKWAAVHLLLTPLQTLEFRGKKTTTVTVSAQYLLPLDFCCHHFPLDEKGEKRE